jgi:PiT family inorganic phosphate transporter
VWALLSGIFMGWALGRNDSASFLGPIFGSGALRMRVGVVLAAGFVFLGAIAVGSRGFGTYSAICTQSVVSAFLVAFAAGFTVTVMTRLSLPVSSTQAIVGAIVGAGLISGSVNLAPLAKVGISWVLTPLGGLVAAYVPYKLLSVFSNGVPQRFVNRVTVLRIGLVVAACYSAYALGANNLANVTGVYVASGLLSPTAGALVGGGAIALGILTFSRKVIETVGGRLVALDALTALIVIVAEAITLNVFGILGVPVSASQAIVGAVLGVGLVKGVVTIDKRVLSRVVFGWLGTPLIAGAVSASLNYLVGPLLGRL